MIEIYTNGTPFEDVIAHSSLVQKFTRDSYAIGIKKEEKSLLLISPMNGNVELFGDIELVAEGFQNLWNLNLKITSVRGEEAKALAFAEEFQSYTKGKYRRLMKDEEKTSYILEKPALARALFSGGCFWCAAMPFYETKGVLRVISGYAGGEELNPRYKDVKAQLTHHRESILIEYNSLDVDYERILEVFFENIDPFDEGGQYIDRGESYTTAVWTSEKYERDRVIEYKYHLSDECGRVCVVPLLDNVPFFMAEDEHQDFAIRHPEEMMEELISSGRIKR